MTDGLTEYRIVDIVDEIAMGPFGSNIKAECFVESGVPVFNGSNLTGFSTNDNAIKIRYHREMPKNWEMPLRKGVMLS